MVDEEIEGVEEIGDEDEEAGGFGEQRERGGESEEEEVFLLMGLLEAKEIMEAGEAEQEEETVVGESGEVVLEHGRENNEAESEEDEGVGFLKKFEGFVEKEDEGAAKEEEADETEEDEHGGESVEEDGCEVEEGEHKEVVERGMLGDPVLAACDEVIEGDLCLGRIGTADGLMGERGRRERCLGIEVVGEEEGVFVLIEGGVVHDGKLMGVGEGVEIGEVADFIGKFGKVGWGEDGGIEAAFEQEDEEKDEEKLMVLPGFHEGIVSINDGGIIGLIDF